MEVPAKNVHVQFAETMPRAAGVAPREVLFFVAGSLRVEVEGSPSYQLLNRKSHLDDSCAEIPQRLKQC